MIIWRITDGKAGHDSQSRGLIQALNACTACTSFEVDAPSVLSILIDFLCRRFSAAVDLPNPDLIIGAGHATHLPMLAARQARGGKVVVLMQPSLPLHWFDLCLIPKHDDPKTINNVIVTEGPLNQIIPSTEHRTDQGLILLGGPSRHYEWSANKIIEQIKMIIKKDPRRWVLTDSPRTPDITRHSLLQLGNDSALTYQPYTECGPDWLPQQLRFTGTVWVSRDSMSMIYEALTSGAAVGVLDVPRKKNDRIIHAVDTLINTKQVISYQNWHKGASLFPPATPLHEAKRCARLILERLSLIKNG